jgi:hypothetical protein
MLAVYAVIARHNGSRIRFSHGDLEGQHMHLAQRSLTDNSINANPLMLLVICEPMLDRGDDARRLRAADIRSSQLPRGVGILGHAFKATTAEW